MPLVVAVVVVLVATVVIATVVVATVFVATVVVAVAADMQMSSAKCFSFFLSQYAYVLRALQKSLNRLLDKKPKNGRRRVKGKGKTDARIA